MYYNIDIYYIVGIYVCVGQNLYISILVTTIQPDKVFKTLKSFSGLGLGKLFFSYNNMVVKIGFVFYNAVNMCGIQLANKVRNIIRLLICYCRKLGSNTMVTKL